VEHAKHAAVAFGSLDLKAPGGEREEVRRNRLRFGEPQAQLSAGGLAGRFGPVRDGPPASQVP
jgi:hypothetical protein